MNHLKQSLKAILIILCIGVSAAKAQQWGDYTLIAPQNSTTAYLVDTNGTTIHTWTFGTSYKTGYSCYLLKGGYLLRSIQHMGNSFMGGGATGEVQKVDWNGNIIWDYVYSTTGYCMHHDILPMPNGNVMLIAWESKTATEATQAGSSISHTMWPDKIVEIQPSGATGGTAVWEWHVWDHLVQNFASTQSNYQTSIVNHPELINVNYAQSGTQSDMMHLNGLDYNAAKDQICVSSHFFNEFYVIDHSTTTAQAASHAGGNGGMGGDLLYRWGNPAAYSATGSTIFNTVHDAHWVPVGCPRAGYLVGYNNNGISNSQSCVDMANPPVSGYNFTITAGSAYLPATTSHRVACNGHNNNMGNSQQFPNGNMLICVAQSGYVYEIDSNANILWSKTVAGASIAQASRYVACNISVTPPPTPTITQSGSVLTSSASINYQWYLNGNEISGATASTYTTTAGGNYQVAAIDSYFCKSSLSAITTVSGGVGINTVENNLGVRLMPNPTTGMLEVVCENCSTTDFTVTIYNLIGKQLLQTKNEKVIDLTNFETGTYLLQINDGKNGTVNRKVSVIR